MRARKRPPRITVVDDDEQLRDIMRETLEVTFDADVTPLPRLTVTLDQVEPTCPDLLIVEVWLVDGAPAPGWALIQAARRHPTLKTVPIIITTADPRGLQEHGDEVAALERVSLCLKPFSLAEFEACVRDALANPERLTAATPLLQGGRATEPSTPATR